jgi:hypothetical protein
VSSHPPQAPTLVTIGDISCTQDHVITPSGTRPIGEVSWTFTNMSHTWQTIPTWAAVCAVVGFFFVCVFSLLFLLAKEDKTEGWAQVVAQAPGFVHTVNLPVSSAYHVTDYSARVDYARSLSAAAAALPS